MRVLVDKRCAITSASYFHGTTGHRHAFIMYSHRASHITY